MMHVHAALQRGLQVIRMPTVGGRLLRLGLLGLPGSLLILGNRNIGLLCHLLLLGRVGLRLLADDPTEADNLVEDHLAHFLDVIDDLEVEVEGCWAGGFV